MAATSVVPLQSLESTIASIVGREHVCSEMSRRVLYSQDIWRVGALAGLVVAPGTSEETAAVVAAAIDAGIAIVPRGGGMSYTAAYLQDQPGFILLDLTRLTAIDANTADMTVTVGAGVTWAQLNATLTPLKLRTPFWGPLSGLNATVGGGVSQNATFLGSGRHGPIGNSVLGLEVVLADGSILKTGGSGEPFLRSDGPDLTGAFIGDCGALGVKVAITLRLIPTLENEGWVSFSFDTRDACAQALGAMQAANAATELFGFDPNLAAQRMKRASLATDMATLGKVIGAQKSLLSGLKEGAKMALAGRGFMDDSGWTIHAATDATCQTAVETDLATLRAIAEQFGGREIENTIPKAIRAYPFTPLNTVLGPSGERWAPVHGIVRLSQGPHTWAKLDALFERYQPRMEALGVTHGFLVTAVHTTGYLIEPVFFWPEARDALHEATIDPAILKRLPVHQPNPASTALVTEMRAAVVDVFSEQHGAHFQIGRTYPWLATRDAGVRAMMMALKSALDPKGLMNPGVLGL